MVLMARARHVEMREAASRWTETVQTMPETVREITNRMGPTRRVPVDRARVQDGIFIWERTGLGRITAL